MSREGKRTRIRPVLPKKLDLNRFVLTVAPLVGSFADIY
jgi:hypothetical protein